MVLATFVALPAISFIAGIISAMVGGSGMIILPCLLLAGLPLPMALGTNKLFTTISLWTAAWGFFKKEIYNPRVWILGMFSTAFGAALGAELIHFISSSLLNYIIPFIIITAAIYCVLTKPRAHTASTPPQGYKAHIKQFALGSCLGIYSGGVGAATGTLWVAALTKFFRLHMLEASAISRFMCFIANFSALLIFAYLQEINYKLGLLSAICGMLGARLGVRWVLSQGAKTMRISLVSATLVMACAFICQNWF